MSKKNRHSDKPAAADRGEQESHSVPPSIESPTNDALPQIGELGSEVQAFLGMRDELAKKLADEIAATEQRLAELKKTAALLFPDSAAKDKKVKKPKAKKPSTAASDSAAGESSDAS